MNKHFVDLDFDSESLTGYASNVTGASWTITTTASPDGLAHQVSVRNDSATDHSAKTITLVGTDADGIPQTEVMNAPGSSATVESTKYFKTLLTATPSATIGADTFDIGWVDEIVSRTIMLNRYSQEPPTVQVVVTGTVNWTLQETLSPREHWASDSAFPVAWVASPNSNLAAQTVGRLADLESVLSAVRLVINSYSAGAEIQFYVQES